MESWKFWGYSVIGPLHYKNGIPNQDSFMAKRYKNGSVCVVCDGLGSRNLSHIGSSVLCNVVCQLTKYYLSSSYKTLNDFFAHIHKNWVEELNEHFVNDCMTTCLFAVQNREKLLLAQLGDGMIVGINNIIENKTIILESDNSSFSNLTMAFSEKYDYNLWKFRELSAVDYDAVILCTDGIADDLLMEKRKSFACAIFNEYNGMNGLKRKNNIVKMLNDWPVPHHTDDKTIACLYK